MPIFKAEFYAPFTNLVVRGSNFKCGILEGCPPTHVDVVVMIVEPKLWVMEFILTNIYDIRI